MTVTETIGALGAWNVDLLDETPDTVLGQLGWFGHIVILAGPIDVPAYGDALLPRARYVGVLRARTKDRRGLAGEGMVFWLGDEDGKGDVIEAEVSLTNATLAECLVALLPSSVTVGTVYPLANPAARYTGKHKLQSRRAALDTVCAAFGVEYRVNGDVSVDVGTQAQLYAAVPDSVIARTDALGTDLDLLGITGTPEVAEQVRDYTTRVVLVGQTQEDGQFATGSTGNVSADYFDLRGNPVKITRLISEANEPEGTVQQRAQLQHNRYNRIVRTLRLPTDEFTSEGSVAVGDMAYVFDPESGIYDRNREREFRGQRIWPDIIRVSGMTWPLTRGHTVAFRTAAGDWVDLTPYVTWESGGGELVVGDLPASLMRRTDDPLAVRVDASRPTTDMTAPQPPTGLELSSTATVDSQGQNVAVITAEWEAPTANVDNSVPVNLAHYAIRWNWVDRLTWQVTYSAETRIDLPAVVDLDYKVQVAAVSRAGVYSEWTPVATIHTAEDDTLPPAPADPIVTPSFKMLRVEYLGVDAAGDPMPPDANRIEVEVGTSTSGPWTVVDNLPPFVPGISYVPAPYGVIRWVRLRAIDHAGNPGAYSAAASGSSVKVVSDDVFDGAIGSAKLADLAVITAKIDNLAVNDAKIGAMSVAKLVAGTMSADVVMAGRFATALTGPRVEINASGVQKFAADGALLVNITGTDALLTGRYRSAASGRRIEMGASGSFGELTFYAPDGIKGAFLRSYTAETGEEGLQFGMPIAGAPPTWNSIFYNEGEWTSYRAKIHDFVYQDRFAVYDTFDRDTSPGGKIRLYLDHNSFQLRAGVLGDETRYLQYFFFDSKLDLRFGENGMFRLQQLGGGNSPGLFLANGDDGLGGMIKSFSDSRGVAIEVRNQLDTGYLGLRAGGFEVNSDGRDKEQIRDAVIDALAAIRAARPRFYERTGGVGRTEIGLVAQEAAEQPALAQVVSGDPDTSMGIDLYQLVVLLLAALKQQDARVTTIASRLTGAIPALKGLDL